MGVARSLVDVVGGGVLVCCGGRCSAGVKSFYDDCFVVRGVEVGDDCVVWVPEVSWRGLDSPPSVDGVEWVECRVAEVVLRRASAVVSRRASCYTAFTLGPPGVVEEVSASVAVLRGRVKDGSRGFLDELRGLLRGRDAVVVVDGGEVVVKYLLESPPDYVLLGGEPAEECGGEGEVVVKVPDPGAGGGDCVPEGFVRVRLVVFDVPFTGDGEASKVRSRFYRVLRAGAWRSSVGWVATDSLDVGGLESAVEELRGMGFNASVRVVEAFLPKDFIESEAVRYASSLAEAMRRGRDGVKYVTVRTARSKARRGLRMIKSFLKRIK